MPRLFAGFKLTAIFVLTFSCPLGCYGLYPLDMAWAGGPDQIYLSEEKASREIFPEAEEYEKQVVPSTPELRSRMKEFLGRTRPSLWETSYTIYLARKKEGELIGYGVIVEEVGKHRPITFIVGVNPKGKVIDVAVMAYREPQGGEVRMKRFLQQYRDKNLDNPLLPHRDIINITGATLSVLAAGRGVKKALALVEAVYLHPLNGSGPRAKPQN